MIYRYRLKECKENEGLNSRQFEGVTLYKKRWLYRDEPIVLDSYLNLIEFEQASDESEFTERDARRRQDKKRAEREYGRSEREQETAQRYTESSKDDDVKGFKKKSIENMTKKELYAEALEREFPEYEIRDLDKSGLFQLLQLEEEVRV